MQSMDACLLDLYERGEITYDMALSHARDAQLLSSRKNALAG
jgi:Tfp pilus assembly ATPase PilU